MRISTKHLRGFLPQVLASKDLGSCTDCIERYLRNIPEPLTNGTVLELANEALKDDGRAASKLRSLVSEMAVDQQRIHLSTNPPKNFQKNINHLELSAKEVSNIVAASLSVGRSQDEVELALEPLIKLSNLNASILTLGEKNEAAYKDFANQIGRLDAPLRLRPGPSTPRPDIDPEITFMIPEISNGRDFYGLLLESIIVNGIDQHTPPGSATVTDGSSSCSGGVLLLSSNSGPWPVAAGSTNRQLVSITFISHDGTRTRADISQARMPAKYKLRLIIPNGATSGIIEIKFKPPKKERSGNVNVRGTSVFRAPFEGGITEISSFDVIRSSRQESKCFSYGDTVALRWNVSNATDVRLSISGILDSIEPIEIYPEGRVYYFVVPALREPTSVSITLKIEGPCISIAAQSTRTLTVMCNRSHVAFDDEILPDGVFSEYERVQGFYEDRPIIIDMFKPRTISEASHVVRIANRDGIQLGCKSTGGSYERITRPDLGNQALIETSAGLDRFIRPSFKEEPEFDSEHWQNSVAEYEKPDYQAFLAEHSTFQLTHTAAVESYRTALRSLLKPDDELTSVLKSDVIQKYEQFALGSSPGTPMPHVSERLVYIEAGTKIFDVHKVLEMITPSLALPTMGASGHQSLAGAISTGTHGATFRLPPLSDFVRAIHLVAATGEIWWVEPDDLDQITENFEDRLPLSSAEPDFLSNKCINVVYDTELFDMLLVGAGNLGLIWGYVIETVPEHNMCRMVDQRSFQFGADYLQKIIFRDPEAIANRESSRVVDHRVEDDVWFAGVTFSSSGDAWIDEQKLTRENPPRQFGLVAWTSIVENSVDTVVDTLETLAGFGVVIGAHYPHIVGRLEAAQKDGNAYEISRLINKIWETWSGKLLTDEIVERFVNSSLSGRNHKYPYENGNWGVSLPSYEVMSNYTPSWQNWNQLSNSSTQLSRAVTSHELTIDADRLIDALVEIKHFADRAREGDDATIFQYNVRLTRGTRASMGQQRWPLSAHIEFFSYADLDGSPALYREIARIAKDHYAKFHWGQKFEFEVNGDEHFSRYPFHQYKLALMKLNRSGTVTRAGDQDRIGGQEREVPNFLRTFEHRWHRNNGFTLQP